MEAVAKEFERLTKKQKVCYEKSLEDIDSMISLLSECKKSLSVSTGDAAAEKMALASLAVRFQEAKFKERADANQKDLHVALAKFAKTVDKQMEPDVERALRILPLDRELVNQLIAQHLYRAGQFETAQVFANESGLQLPADSLEPFKAMHAVMTALQQGNFEPAIRWVDQHHEDLQRIGSDLQFLLHKLRFLQLVRSGDRLGAVYYARQFLAPLAPKHMSALQRLMGCLAYANRLDRSPYADLFNDRAAVSEACSRLARDACLLLGLSHDSPLDVIVSSGYVALPVLLKAANLMQGREMPLPIEVDLGPTRRFHSIFACPVSKEQSTPDNRPMLMKCGHVLAEASLQKLARTPQHRFKCPYCPMEQTRDQARPIYF